MLMACGPGDGDNGPKQHHDMHESQSVDPKEMGKRQDYNQSRQGDSLPHDHSGQDHNHNHNHNHNH